MHTTQARTKEKSLSSNKAAWQPKPAIRTLFLLTLLECDGGATLSQEPLAVALAEVAPEASWWLENRGAKAGRWVRSALTSASNAPEKSCISYLWVSIKIRFPVLVTLTDILQTAEY